MAFCPNCGTQHADAVAKCTSCGRELKPARGAAGAKFKGTMLMPGASPGALAAQLRGQAGQTPVQPSGRTPSGADPGAMPQPAAGGGAGSEPQAPGFADRGGASGQTAGQGHVQQPAPQPALAFQQTVLGTPETQPLAQARPAQSGAAAAPQPSPASGSAAAQAGGPAAARPSLKGTVVVGAAPPAFGQVSSPSGGQADAHAQAVGIAATQEAASAGAASPTGHPAQGAHAPGCAAAEAGMPSPAGSETPAGGVAQQLAPSETSPAQKARVWLWALLACAALLAAIAIASGLLRG